MRALNESFQAKIPGQYVVIGLMSGTSLDGLDLARVLFRPEGHEGWRFELMDKDTLPYPEEWREKLASAHRLPAFDLLRLHSQYGTYLGECVRDLFRPGFEEYADFVASHGHTVHHRPDQGVTFQLGSGDALARAARLPVYWDFRSHDVALGGQGAPLVPVADHLLFGQFDACLNLGGFANVSSPWEPRPIVLVEAINHSRAENPARRQAFDICPVNFVANLLARRLGREYDPEGQIGRQGQLLPDLLRQLDDLPFYRLNGPKSLGREWVETAFMPLLEAHPAPVEDLLRTFYEHAARQIAQHLPRPAASKVLATGGGALNSFLLERIRKHADAQVVLPERAIIDYKEAIAFAFLGLLRHLGQHNVWACVTGASADSCSGLLSLP